MSEDTMTTEDTTTPATGSTTTTNAIPYDRFQSVVTERNDLKGQVTTLTEQLQGAMAKSATADTLTAQIDEMQSAHTKAQADWGVDREMLTAGLTDAEGRDVAKFLFGKLATEGKPTLADWLATAKADPTQAPKALAPYLATKPTEAAPTSAPTPPGVPNANTGATSTEQPASASPLSADKVKELRLQAMATGDWSAYRASRDGLLASLRKA